MEAEESDLAVDLHGRAVVLTCDRSGIAAQCQNGEPPSAAATALRAQTVSSVALSSTSTGTA